MIYQRFKYLDEEVKQLNRWILEDPDHAQEYIDELQQIENNALWALLVDGFVHETFDTEDDAIDAFRDYNFQHQHDIRHGAVSVHIERVIQ